MRSSFTSTHWHVLQGVTGSKMESVCDLAHITLNKNAVVGDVSAMTPGGVRIGAPAMTSRGLVRMFYFFLFFIFVLRGGGSRCPPMQHPCRQLICKTCCRGMSAPLHPSLGTGAVRPGAAS